MPGPANKITVRVQSVINIMKCLPHLNMKVCGGGASSWGWAKIEYVALINLF